MSQRIIQIRHLTLVNREWFTLPVNVWLKAKTAIPNKFSINIIPKKQQIGNNNNNDDDNSDSNDDNNNNKILYWEIDFSWTLTMSEISLNSFENCTISSKLHIRLWSTSKFSPRSLYEQKCFLFFTQKNVIHGWRNYSWKRHYKYALSSSDSWCLFWNCFRVFKKCMV